MTQGEMFVGRPPAPGIERPDDMSEEAWKRSRRELDSFPIGPAVSETVPKVATPDVDDAAVLEARTAVQRSFDRGEDTPRDC